MAEGERWKPYTQRQGQLLPAFVEDALDPSDPVFFINDVVDSLDLAPLEQRYAVLGEHAYSPRLLLKVWLYGATQGVYSGREIARRLGRDLAFRYLAGEGPVPDFRTINRFRVRHRDDFAWVLRETVRLARAAGVGQLGLVTIDGTKVRANTSRHKAMSHGRMVAEEARLERECAAIVARMDEVNATEDAEHGADDDGSGGLPAELQSREQRLAKLRAVRAQLEAERGARLTPRSQKSFADPDAQMMATGDGALTYAYNAQAAVSTDGFVVASGVTTAVRDTGELLPMAAAIAANTGERPAMVIADNGYLTEENLATLRRKGQRCLLGVGREGKAPARWPQGRETQRMHRLLRLPWARSLYARRKTQAERPHAEIKWAMGFRRFALRGVAKVRGEWDLVCAAFNLRRLCALGVAGACRAP
jgi:transposase